MNEEQMAKAREAKSAEELLALAKENGMEMTEEEAADLYERLHSSTELTDEELENVAGGCGSTAKKDGVTYEKCGERSCFMGGQWVKSNLKWGTLSSSQVHFCNNCAHAILVKGYWCCELSGS